MKNRRLVIITLLIFGTLTACNAQEVSTPDVHDLMGSPALVKPPVTVVPSPTPEPPSVLTICSQEPGSLFLYGDSSAAARNVRQAIYDGPFDVINYQVEPVILTRTPSFGNGDVIQQPVEVAPGDLIVDANGDWVTFTDGVLYRPSDCEDSSCAMIFEGQDTVQMDAMVIQFRLKPGIFWSDGEPLTAADSVTSFDVYQGLFERVSPELLRFTKFYLAVDDQVVEWRGIPGYVGTIAPKFFSPLPTHQLRGLGNDALLTSPLTNRTPMGWGPYIIDEWVDGDHITLNRNPKYYRAGEGYPPFDHLVYRFFEDGEVAIDALVIGECDFIDQNLLTEAHIPRLYSEQEAGRIKFSFQSGTSWELAAFGINTLSDQRLDIFESREVRQAIAMCINRQKIVDQILYGESFVPESYVPPNHPLYEASESHEYDPGRALELLASVGWVDHDVNSQTPLVSSGVQGVPDGTLLNFTYLVPSDGERPQVGTMISEDLNQCGMEVDLVIEEWDTLMVPGPDGALFGRQFDMAQFAWSSSLDPACKLFTSDEIPGPYPDHPKGWGGANLTGYSNPTFDNACLQAMLGSPESEAYIQSHREAQGIFAEDLPVIPLFQRFQLAAMRPDICGESLDPAGFNNFSQIETLAYGKFCK